ncbi:MAG: carbohydrate porin, partial [Chthoniobacterales bacterium]
MKIRLLWISLLIITAARSAYAQQDTQLQALSAPKPSANFMEWDHLTGNWWGLRDKLADRGVKFDLTYFAEVWGNPTGGFSQGAVYTGLGILSSTVDFEKLAGWKGASFHTSWLWLSGQDISQDYVGNIFTVSNIAGFQTFRMYETWGEQQFFNNLISVRAGQLGLDTEFIISSYGSLFINSTFGWPAFMGSNITNNGPAYPIGSPGVRLQIKPTDWLTYRGAITEANVFSQSENRYGFRWELNSTQGYLSIHELQFQWNQSKGLPGTLKTGGWFLTGVFPSPQNPANLDRGNYGFYGILDQMVYRAPSPPSDGTAGSRDKKQVDVPLSDNGLGIFSRIAFGPEDHNFINFYVEDGLVYKGLIPERKSDSLGVAMAYGQLSNGYQNYLSDAGFTNPGYEIAVEFTYQAVITPWLSIQPDIQLILHPGGTGTYN